MSYAVKHSKPNSFHMPVVATVETIEAGIEYIQKQYPVWNIYWERDPDGHDAADVFIYKGAMSEVFAIEKVK